MSAADSTREQNLPLRENEIRDTSSVDREGTPLDSSRPQARGRNTVIPSHTQQSGIHRTRIKHGVSEAGTAVTKQKIPDRSGRSPTQAEMKQIQGRKPG